MTRRCSHCGNNGHNSRTCPNRGVKIFGVRFDGGGSIRKTQSMGNLSQYAGGSGGGSPATDDGGDEREKDGYASEDCAKGSSSSCRERKKGVAWTEEEHRMFLLGLQKLGKGDWRGISRKFVISRTATQVASHAQKYFLRQTNANRRKRRTSLFDMVPDEVGEAQPFPFASQEPDTYKNDDNCHLASDSSNPAPAPPSFEDEHEPMKLNSSNLVAAPPPPLPPPLPTLPPLNVQPYTVDMEGAALRPGAMPYPYPMMFPPYPPFFPFSYPFWPCYRADAMVSKAQSVKPTAQHSTAPINVDQLASMSKLRIGDADVEGNSPAVPLNLLGGSGRHSAFHTSNLPSRSSRMNSSSSPIHAI